MTEEINTESNKLEMIAKQNANKTKLVKIRALRTIRVNNQEHPRDSIVEVTEKEAEEFCKPIEGSFNFEGEREGEQSKTDFQKILRAERI